MPELEVSGLNIYPIKSCAATALNEMDFTERGPLFDREWMLVNERGTFLTQRNRPELARIKPTVLDYHDGSLMVEAPGMETLYVFPDGPSVEKPVEFWKKAGTGRTQAPEANEWFSSFLGRTVELLRVEQPRPVKPECRVAGAVETVGFADSFPILLTSEASLAKLNTQLQEPIPMDRFRPNIVVRARGGDVPAYDEDYWRSLTIGNLSAFVVRACSRCPIPETDQSTGLRAAAKGLVTEALNTTRHGLDPVNMEAGNFFGQNLVHIFEPDTTVRLGDTVIVESRAPERNIIF